MDPQSTQPQPQSTPPTQPVVTPVEPPKPKSKMPLILVIASLLILLTIGGILAWRKMSSPPPVPAQISAITPPPTNSLNCNVGAKTSISADAVWNNYESTACGFSFSYPKDWYFSSYEPEQGNALIVGDVANPAGVDPESLQGHHTLLVNFLLGIAPNSFPYTNGSENNSTIKPYTVNNLVGIRGQQTSTSGTDEVAFLQQSDQKAYVQFVWTGDDTQLFDQILSTFKFTGLADISSWKTYTNLDYGFTFDYPTGDDNYHTNFGQDLVSVSPVGDDFPYIWIQMIKTGLTADAWWNSQNTEDWTSIPTKDFNVSHANFLGKQALALELKPEILDRFSGNKLYLINHGGAVLKIFANQSEISKQILSTFKFTKIETYVNDEFKFSVDHSSNERVVECLNNNPPYHNLAAWIVTTPKYEGECGVEGGSGGIYVDDYNKGPDSVDNHLTRVKNNYSIEIATNYINGVKWTQIKGSLKNHAPIPQTIDQSITYREGTLYIIGTDYLQRNFRLL